MHLNHVTGLKIKSAPPVAFRDLFPLLRFFVSFGRIGLFFIDIFNLTEASFFRSSWLLRTPKDLCTLDARSRKN